jgi:hypothetical protein
MIGAEDSVPHFHFRSEPDLDAREEPTFAAKQWRSTVGRTTLRRFMLAVLGLCVLAPAPAQAQSIEWTQRSVSGPSPRSSHAMAYDSARRVTVLFGGWNGSNFNGETWEWNGSTWTQRAVSGPSPRDSHAMAYDSVRGVTVLFGGMSFGPTYYDDTWEWNGTVWTQRMVSGPSPRSSHAMAYDAARGVTVLFGGFRAAYYDDTWEWNGAAWTQRMVSGPSPRTNHAMSYDAARAVTVLFGGYWAGVNRGETWEWNGSGWAQRADSGPSLRNSHRMAYDAARAVTVLFGGYTNSGPNDETWEWNGTAWSQRLISGPSPGGRPIAYDAVRAVTVLCGGSNSETWTLWNPEPGANTPHVQPHYDVLPQPAAGQNKLVLLVHGWNTAPSHVPPNNPNPNSASLYNSYWVPLADAIRAHGGPQGVPLGPDWNVVAYDWTSDCGNPGVFGLPPIGQDPDWALGMAGSHGRRVGADISLQHYTFVHLIGHSAGAGLLAEAAKQIRATSPGTMVHTTYLDAYCGDMRGFGEPGGPDGFLEAYGGKSHWSEQYYSMETLNVTCAAPTLWWTQQRVAKSYNVDVTSADPVYDLFIGRFSTHCWPRCFYFATIPFHGALPECAAPIGNLGGFGFPLSFEAQGGDPEVWLAERRSAFHPYPPDNFTILSGGPAAPSTSYVARVDPYMDPSSTPMYPSGLWGVQVSPNTLIMFNPLRSPVPTWVSFLITTAEPTNYLAFDMEFTSGAGAAGLVSVYIDGVERGLVDEPYTAPGSHPYSMPTPGELGPGQHVIGFRLDPLNAVPSSVTIRNMATGFGQFVYTCYANCDESTVPPNLNVADFTCFLQRYASGSPHANCDESTTQPVLNVADFTCFLQKFAGGCP